MPCLNCRRARATTTVTVAPLGAFASCGPCAAGVSSTATVQLVTYTAGAWTYAPVAESTVTDADAGRVYRSAKLARAALKALTSANVAPRVRDVR